MGVATFAFFRKELEPGLFVAARNVSAVLGHGPFHPLHGFRILRNTNFSSLLLGSSSLLLLSIACRLLRNLLLCQVLEILLGFLGHY